MLWRAAVAQLRRRRRIRLSEISIVALVRSSLLADVALSDTRRHFSLLVELCLIWADRRAWRGG